MFCEMAWFQLRIVFFYLVFCPPFYIQTVWFMQLFFVSLKKNKVAFCMKDILVIYVTKTSLVLKT